jgi:capsular exopolysaccharide synthesis family protein
MGRFFNTLKEAGRTLPADGAPAQPFSSLADSLMSNRSALLDDEGTIAANENEPINTEPQFAVPVAPIEWSTQADVKLVLDKKAHLIPHAIDSAVVECYRRLRTKLMQQHATKPFRSLLVSSPGPEEGKTVTALNLALSFAMLASFKVLLVDGDLRKGSIGKLLGVPFAPGFSNLIDGSATPAQVVLKSDEFPLHVVVRGTSEVPAAELLNSPRLGSQLRCLSEHFDLILVDSAPVNLITDTHLLAANCDAVLLVARAFNTSSKAFEKAVSDLNQFRIVGTVLNGATRSQPYRRYEGYY